MSLTTEAKRNKGYETKTRLLQAAAEEFAKKGYHATKVSSIVAAANLTQPAFYIYFQSKQQIFDQLVTTFTDRLQELVRHGRFMESLSVRDIQQRIYTECLALFEFLGSDPNLTRIALYVSPNAEGIKTSIARLVVRNLEENVKDGLPSGNIEFAVVSESLVGIFQRLTEKFLLTGDKSPRELAVPTSNFILHGLLS